MTAILAAELTPTLGSDLQFLNGEYVKLPSRIGRIPRDERLIPPTMSIKDYVSDYVNPNFIENQRVNNINADQVCARLRESTKGIRVISLYEAQAKLPPHLRDPKLRPTDEIVREILRPSFPRIMVDDLIPALPPAAPLPPIPKNLSVIMVPDVEVAEPSNLMPAIAEEVEKDDLLSDYVPGPRAINDFSPVPPAPITLNLFVEIPSDDAMVEPSNEEGEIVEQSFEDVPVEDTDEDAIETSSDEEVAKEPAVESSSDEEIAVETSSDEEVTREDAVEEPAIDREGSSEQVFVETSSSEEEVESAEEDAIEKPDPDNIPLKFRFPFYDEEQIQQMLADRELDDDY